MTIVFSTGRIIANQHEVVVRLDGASRVSLQATVDDITLLGRGANVITAMGSGVNWSLRLDSEQQLEELAEILGIAIQ
ncbi:DUF3389 domain-containing protein [Photobacterium rosenbergii]|uniref:DUF3389 domain-containing protein n=1 Tax=Photobacterium rosenbergii TaxID=294936 RepID=A0ABU3ZCS9_9GAMM|nr:DUF3389 domain-containing protein [Photobacterium rosenbergii]MDV5167724.1 DUF3389 domain-containing protein [Photobacterium rosenbergii]